MALLNSHPGFCKTSFAIRKQTTAFPPRAEDEGSAEQKEPAKKPSAEFKKPKSPPPPVAKKPKPGMATGASRPKEGAPPPAAAASGSAPPATLPKPSVSAEFMLQARRPKVPAVGEADGDDDGEHVLDGAARGKRARDPRLLSNPGLIFRVELIYSPLLWRRRRP